MNTHDFGRLTLPEFRAMQRVWNIKQDREDYRSASIQALLANINRDIEKRPEPFAPSDFMTRREDIPMRQAKQEPALTPEAINENAINLLRKMTATFSPLPN